MKKKYFIPISILMMLPLLIILPYLNYTLDPWRVMHHDYSHAYNQISINKNFLKVSYLIDNPNKYDTLLMGSSRNAALNASLISEKGYNMYYEFGVAGAHLHNLKTLLDHNVSIKNLWLGVNDYATWKDPKDHELDYSKKPYPNGFLENLDFYRLYLLKKIDNKDIEIITRKIVLESSNRILRENLTDHFNQLKEREESLVKKPDAWKKKMTQTGAASLGYTDTTYRIDKAIDEIAQIKKLCDTHDINLTVFIYPVFYKTYLIYNQYKIETFKRKLAATIPFYDFYNLNEISLNELKWTDSSHFALSIGNYIIRNIKKNNFLVTNDTIDKHILQTRNSFKNMMHKVLPIRYLVPITSQIDLSVLHPIFNFSKNKYTQNNQCQVTHKKYYSQFTAISTDPVFYLTQIHPQSENTILHVDIESPHDTQFQIFYKDKKDAIYSEKYSYTKQIKKGRTQLNVLIPSLFINNGLRIDLASTIGTYKVHSLILYDSK